MRSFTPKTLRTAALTMSLIAVPVAGVYAAGHQKGKMDETATRLIDQVQGVDKGISDARLQKTISPAEAQKLHMRAAHISQAAQRAAAADHGRISTAQYQQLMQQIDSLDQTLLSDTGSGENFGNGGDGGHYPNG
jgi:hypothetical protein